jgi:protein-tyrosine-phosphatase
VSSGTINPPVAPVLFLCIEIALRSQRAEALFRRETAVVA